MRRFLMGSWFPVAFAMMQGGMPGSLAASQTLNGEAASLRAEAFMAAQSATLNPASAALSKIAAGFATGSNEVGSLERKREDLVTQLGEVEKRYRAILGEQSQRHVTQRGILTKEADRLRASIRDLGTQIERIDPGYYDLTRPHPLSVAQTQKLLNPDEAVLLIMVGADASYSFAVSHDTVEWSRAPSLGRADLFTKISQLRRGLQIRTSGAVDEKQSASAFDRELAFDLYNKLIKPVENVFSGKRVLMTATSGPLGALPLQVLVTDKPIGRDDDPAALQATRFMADRYVMTVLPSVSSLRALRCLLITREDRHPGCDVGNGRIRRQLGRGSIEVAGFGAPTLLGDPAVFKGPPPYSKAYAGDLADTEFLRGLPYLQGSRRELDWLSREYGSRAVVKIGDAATEKELKSSADLRNARYVVLSTHGLLAGEGGIVGESGLVFTPPASEKKTPLDDGLLTASEAAQLTLSADFVVLSACNTAASDGSPAGEGLSGLARSFFYAGARALLVSNWEVNEDATVELVRQTFSTFENGPAHDRASALQYAMRAVRAKPQWASPRYWGAFVMVGIPD